MAGLDHLRHHRRHQHKHGTFGNDKFGVYAEKFAATLGTPKYLLGQTAFVILWMLGNGYFFLHALHTKPYDPYPWILLNLIFSTQAAYAAPLILLAQTRQAARDKASEEASAKHRQEIADDQAQQLALNTQLTEQIHSMQTAQMNILGALEHANEELDILKEAGRGGSRSDKGCNCQPGSGQCAPGPVNVAGVLRPDQPADAPGLPEAPGG